MPCKTDRLEAHASGIPIASSKDKVRDEGDPPIGDADADAAYDFSGDAYHTFFIQYNRFYFAQSGALNESYSDIFGETVNLVNTTGTDIDPVRWLVGEDLPDGALRNMMDLTTLGDPGDPGKLSDEQLRCDPESDDGGVHSNSGIPNHAYALMGRSYVSKRRFHDL